MCDSSIHFIQGYSQPTLFFTRSHHISLPVFVPAFNFFYSSFLIYLRFFLSPPPFLFLLHIILHVATFARSTNLSPQSFPSLFCCYSSRFPPMWRNHWHCLASSLPKSTSCWHSSAPWRHSGPSPCETGATWPPSSWRHCRGRWSTPQVSSNSSCLTSLIKIWRARTIQSSYSGGMKKSTSLETHHTCTNRFPTRGSSLRSCSFFVCINVQVNVYYFPESVSVSLEKASLRKRTPLTIWLSTKEEQKTQQRLSCYSSCPSAVMVVIISIQNQSHYFTKIEKNNTKRKI